MKNSEFRLSLMMQGLRNANTYNDNANNDIMQTFID